MLESLLSGAAVTLQVTVLSAIVALVVAIVAGLARLSRWRAVRLVTTVYVELFRGRSEMVILDGVCATGGIDERFDEWGLDVLLTAPQKAIGAPPGVALCVFSERAIERRRSRSSIPA
ncbi:MAG: ABC transporter permease subunit, partial [Acidimicrobiales bacterium]